MIFDDLRGFLMVFEKEKTLSAINRTSSYDRIFSGKEIFSTKMLRGSSTDCFAELSTNLTLIKQRFLSRCMTG